MSATLKYDQLAIQHAMSLPEPKREIVTPAGTEIRFVLPPVDPGGGTQVWKALSFAEVCGQMFVSLNHLNVHLYKLRRELRDRESVINNISEFLIKLSAMHPISEATTFSSVTEALPLNLTRSVLAVHRHIPRPIWLEYLTAQRPVANRYSLTLQESWELRAERLAYSLSANCLAHCSILSSVEPSVNR